jgi:hypothetical protein
MYILICSWGYCLFLFGSEWWDNADLGFFVLFWVYCVWWGNSSGLLLASHQSKWITDCFCLYLMLLELLSWILTLLPLEWSASRERKQKEDSQVLGILFRETWFSLSLCLIPCSLTSCLVALPTVAPSPLAFVAPSGLCLMDVPRAADPGAFLFLPPLSSTATPYGEMKPCGQGAPCWWSSLGVSACAWHPIVHSSQKPWWSLLVPWSGYPYPLPPWPLHFQIRV